MYLVGFLTLPATTSTIQCGAFCDSGHLVPPYIWWQIFLMSLHIHSFHPWPLGFHQLDCPLCCHKVWGRWVWQGRRRHRDHVTVCRASVSPADMQQLSQAPPECLMYDVSSAACMGTAGASLSQDAIQIFFKAISNTGKWCMHLWMNTAWYAWWKGGGIQS